MKNLYLLNSPGLLMGLVLLLSSCRQEEEVVKQSGNPQVVNSFAMTLNGQVWRPSSLGEDKCQQAFHAAWSAVAENSREKPYYTIWAYRDPRGNSRMSSENALELQIFDVKKTGEYALTGSYREHLGAYALFVINKTDGTTSRYVNKTDEASFVVNISEFVPVPGSGVAGIKGTFAGTLYNESSPQDSLVIGQGTFTLKKVNWYNFNQCAP